MQTGLVSNSENGGHLAADQLVTTHVWLVRAIAKKVLEKLPSHVELNDLIEDGVFGLIAAAQRYDVVDVTPPVIDILRERTGPNFYSTFGDYRRSREPTLGVGDVVALSIWEAGSSGLFSSTPPGVVSAAGAKGSTIPDQPVGRDGAITVPYAGRLRIAGLTISEAQRWSDRGLPYPVAAAVDTILQVIAGLECAQQIGILHRDIILRCR